MLSDTEDDLPRLEAEYHAALNEVLSLESRIRWLKEQASDNYRKSFFQWLRERPNQNGGQHGADK